jgi:repressor LexA
MTAYVVQGANPPPRVCDHTNFRAGLFRLHDYYIATISTFQYNYRIFLNFVNLHSFGVLRLLRFYKKELSYLFWNNFVSLCNGKGVSPNAVGKALGISSGSISWWKKGRIPHDSTLQKLADYFGVSVDYLLGETNFRSRFADAEFSSEFFGEDQRKRGVKIPVFGNVAAGIPIEAIEDIEDYEEIPEEMARGGEYFALRIKGDSMMPRIIEGDVIIVRKQPAVESGDLAVVLVNGSDATCKKVVIGKSELSLISFNPVYEPMTFTKKEVRDLPVSILGKVVELRGKF